MWVCGGSSWKKEGVCFGMPQAFCLCECVKGKMVAEEILDLQTLWEMGVFSYGQIELHFLSVFSLGGEVEKLV